MYFEEAITNLRNENPDIDNLALAHNCGDRDALDNLPVEIIETVRNLLSEQCGDTITLYHGCETDLTTDMIWHENSSFTDEFDIEFAGEDGYIIEAQVPVDRIKFFLNEEREFVISAGQLDCAVYTVAEYFGL